ncbi:MAG TPA: hypothetical protein PLG43_07690 [Spirochaetia bacterium]|nr:hypothetical protein [Spirochaetia bacterium]
MIKRVEPIEGLFVRIEEEDKTYLGIRISENTRAYALTQSGGKKDLTGFLVKEGSVSPWPMERILAYEGQVFGCGPFFEGKTLHSIIESGRENPTELIQQLARAFSVLEAKVVSRIMTTAVFIATDGSMLFLPDEIISRIEHTSSEEVRIAAYTLYNHPDLTEEANLSFVLGSLSYKILTGTSPFSGDTEEDVRQAIREKQVVELIYQDPEIKPEVSAFIMSVLTGTEGKPPSLADWVRTSTLWHEQGVRRTISEEERKAIIAEREKKIALAEKKYRTKEFFRKHWKVMTIIAVALVIAASIAGSILKNVLAPPVTMGLSAEEVVRLFYMSQNTLDHQTIEDCVTEDAGKQEINEAMNLFVISRVRTAYEHTTGYIDADEWTKKGRPELQEGEIPYGVTNLIITKKGEGVFRAEYEKWMPGTEETTEQKDAPPKAQVFKRVDELYLREEKFRDGRTHWAIYRIDRLEDRLLE